MGKGIGVTTIGAILLAGMGLRFQFRPGDAPEASRVRDAAAKQTNAGESAKPNTADGPWLASCNYWSAVSTPEAGKSDTPTEVSSAQGSGDKQELKAAADGGPSCSSGNWAIPGDKAEVSVIVATVPDPIHSHLALDFDRSIDAMLLAAADNHYLGSYYWLPWRSQINNSSGTDSTANASKPTAADTAREQQPGLIVLRYAPDAADVWHSNFKTVNYYRVVYLFLVAETPSLGVNGNQLKNAFAYEKLLRDKYLASLSILPDPFRRERQDKTESVAQNQPQSSDGAANQGAANDDCVSPAPANKLSIIGPNYSGSAASLHAGVEAALPGLGNPCVSITGITGTQVAAQELNPDPREHKHPTYQSFGENISFEQERFLQALAASDYKLNRVAVLSEAGTVFGKSTKQNELRPGKRPSDIDLAQREPILNISFPRELSLLRNAEPNQKTDAGSSAPPTPYLNLSLKDYSADDTVPRFSTNQSPLSIEAQLMAIAHQLQRARIQFIAISASNILDDIFLADFLHRACPDARLVILSGGDLLFERDVDNSKYIGSLSISPYLLSSLDFGNHVQWLHAGYSAESVYNAANFTFWNGTANPPPLAGYRGYPVTVSSSNNTNVPQLPVQFQQLPLWAEAMGADGYYPLAVLNWCASDLDSILPTVETNSSGSSLLAGCNEKQSTAPVKTAAAQRPWQFVPESIGENSGISPSLPWGILAGFIMLACVSQAGFFWAADLWSPFTRDLAIDQNDLPQRRAVYLNISTSVLAVMAFITAFPLIKVGSYFPVAVYGHVIAWMTICVGCLATAVTFTRTWRYAHHPRQPEYLFFNVLALLALTIIVISWILICSSGNHGNYPNYAGLYFSYRCLRPLSGLCPLLPVLFLLLAWYLWGIWQTARLRFSDVHRPRLPRFIRPSQTEQASPQVDPYNPDICPYPLYVADEVLEGSRPGLFNNHLYDNIQSLLITRQIISRVCNRMQNEPKKRIRTLAAWGLVGRRIEWILLSLYLVLFFICIFAVRIHGIDGFLFGHFLFHHVPSLYELLIMTLFFPLIMIALSGWLRMILIWGALSRDLLEPLERMPLRFAFTRYKSGGWMSMLRQKGLHVRWRDMGRATESIRLLVHHPELQNHDDLKKTLLEQYEVLNLRIHDLMKSRTGAARSITNDALVNAQQRAEEYETPCTSATMDLPEASADLCTIYKIEQAYAEFSRLLIEKYLAKYWDSERTGFVEDINEPGSGKDAGEAATEKTSPASFAQQAEEFIVVRYVALIRAVLINVRYLMLFVSAAFVLALIAWNSYPFQPHAFIDWCFTLMLGLLTLGFVWVFAQMHRNAILSRITNTEPNELGWEFYLRLAAFGAVPILTWLAYQFPQLGGSIYRIVQPGLQVVK